MTDSSVWLPTRHKANRVNRCKMGITCSNTQAPARPALIKWCLTVCMRVCLCVLAEAAATTPLALWLQLWRLFLNEGPVLSLRQAVTGTAAHLSCQHSLCLPGIYLAALFGCVCVYVRWIKTVMHVFFLFLDRREGNDTHTPLTLHCYDLTCTQTQLSWGGDLFEDIQTTC